MEAMTQSWADDRIGDLAQRVDNGFAQVDRRFEQSQEEQRELRLWVTHAHREVRIASERSAREVREELRSEIQALGNGLNRRFDGLQQTLLKASFAAIFCLIAGIVTLIATQIS